MKKLIVLLVVTVMMFVLAGCDLLGLNGGTGDLAMYIADAPVNGVKEVNVTFKEVQVCRVVDGEEFWETINDFADQGGEATFDLLKLRFNEDILGQQTLPTGQYNQIRLIVAAKEEGTVPTETGKSYIVYEDPTLEPDNIFIPSGQQTGLKLTHNFMIEEGKITELLLDINVREVLHSAGNSGQIILNPSTAINIIDKVVSGDIQGRVFVDVDGNGTVDTDSDGLPDEVLTSTEYDVVIEAVNATGEVVGSTVATNEPVDGKETGSYLIRGLLEGDYTIRAKVMGDINQDGTLEEVSSYQLQEEKTVTVTAEEVSPVGDLILLQTTQ